MQSTRVASHAGSWYTNVPQTLAQQLTAWLQGVELTENKAKAVIAPHAGYSYSGPTAAWAYRHFDGNSAPRVVLLGPSHHTYIEGCALPWAGTYDTPLGAIPVDQETVAELQSSGAFQTLSKEEEEDEHSLEMQLPYIRHVFAGKAITLVPIMVGQLSPELEERYARILKPLFEDENTVFVVSSDFCVRIQPALGRPLPSHSIRPLQRRNLAVYRVHRPPRHVSNRARRPSVPCTQSVPSLPPRHQ